MAHERFCVLRLARVYASAAYDRAVAAGCAELAPHAAALRALPDDASYATICAATADAEAAAADATAVGHGRGPRLQALRHYTACAAAYAAAAVAARCADDVRAARCSSAATCIATAVIQTTAAVESKSALDGAIRTLECALGDPSDGGVLAFAIATAGHSQLLAACLESIQHLGACGVAVTFDGTDADAECSALLDRHSNAPNCWAATTTHLATEGISKSWNAAIAHCLQHQADLICVLNDDTYLPTGFIKQYTEFFAAHPEVRLACSFDRLTARTVFPWVAAELPREWAEARMPPDPAVRDQLHPTGLDNFARRFDAHDPWFLPCRLNGACMVFRREVFDAGELFWDGLLPPGLYEDLDMYLRLLTKYGPKALGGNARSYIHHVRAVTVSNFPRQWSQPRIDENAVRFRRRWPLAQWGDIETWLSTLNATPTGTPEPPLPRPRWWP